MSTNSEIPKTELEEKFKIKVHEYKYETSSCIDMKLLTLN